MKRVLTGLLWASWIVLCCRSVAAESAVSSQNRPRDFALKVPIFKAEQELRTWVREHLTAPKLEHFEGQGRRVYVAVEYIGSGRIYASIYIFTHEPKSGTWGAVAFWSTDSSDVKILTARRGRDLVFKTKSGKTLFQVPFEALEPKNDPDY